MFTYKYSIGFTGFIEHNDHNSDDYMQYNYKHVDLVFNS